MRSEPHSGPDRQEDADSGMEEVDVDSDTEKADIGAHVLHMSQVIGIKNNLHYAHGDGVWVNALILEVFSARNQKSQAHPVLIAVEDTSGFDPQTQKKYVRVSGDVMMTVEKILWTALDSRLRDMTQLDMRVVLGTQMLKGFLTIFWNEAYDSVFYDDDLLGWLVSGCRSFSLCVTS